MHAEVEALKANGKKTLEHFKKELTRIRTGRAHTSLLEGLHVDYYGSSVPLQQVGLVNAPEARLLTIQVFDGGAVESVEKAILASELGLNPSRDGNLIRLAIPPLTEERRKDLVKKIHKMAEETKVIIRNHRRDANDLAKKLEKEKTISSDESKKHLEEIQRATDGFVKDVDVMVAGKEKEIMEV